MPAGDTSWFPKPPPKPLRAPSTTKLFVGVLVVIALIGAGVSLATTKHPKERTSTGVTATTEKLSPADLARQRRQAFNDCVKTVGGGSLGGSGVGRFRTRPDPNKLREAYNLCRSVLQGGPPGSETTPTSTVPPPVA